MQSKSTNHLDREPIELVEPKQFYEAGPPRFGGIIGSVHYPVGRSSITLPRELLNALREERIPLVVFLNQYVVTEGDYRRLEEVTKKFEHLYNKVVERIEATAKKRRYVEVIAIIKHLFGKKHTDLYKETRSILRYHEEFEKTGQLPNRCIKPPSWEAQVEISSSIIDVLSEIVREPSSDNQSYDMSAALENRSNCVVTCLYFIGIARRLGLHADIYYVPHHVIVGITLNNRVHFLDPTLGINKVELKKTTFVIENGQKIVINYTNPRKMDCYGLAAAFSSKANMFAEKGRLKLYAHSLTEAHEYYHRAIREAENALKVDPTDAHSWINKGSYFSTLFFISIAQDKPEGNAEYYETARDAYDTVLKTEPNNVLALFCKCCLLFLKKQNSEARALIERARRYDQGELLPYVLDQFLELAFLLHKISNDESAFAVLEEFLDITPGNPKALCLKGRLLLLKKQYSKAVEALDGALRKNQKISEAAYLRIIALRHLEKFEEMLDAIETFLKNFPESEHAEGLIKLRNEKKTVMKAR